MFRNLLRLFMHLCLVAITGGGWLIVLLVWYLVKKK